MIRIFEDILTKGKLSVFQILTLLFVLFFINLNGQKVVGSSYLTSTSKEEILNDFGILPPYDVDMYQVLYETLDISGEQDTASGLLVLPVDPESAFPLLIYEHGTLSVRDDVPSQLGGGYQLAMILAAYGYISMAPDYLGMGTSRGFHPFVHAETEASASIDMLRAGKEFLTDQDIAFNDQLFITGYSQGGHAAMATHRSLELDHQSEFSVTASAPLSGPYSISEKMVESTLGDNEFFYPGFLIYTALSFRLAYPELLEDLSLENMLKEAYLDVSNQFKNRDISISNLNNQLIDLLTAEEGMVTPKAMLKDEILNSILNDPDYSLNQALRWNDVYEWAPQAPTRLYYCMADDQVYFENSLLAEEVMNQMGAASVDAIDLGPTLDHGECITPAMINTIIFFSTYRDISSSIEDHHELAVNTLIYPNPASHRIFVSIPEEFVHHDNQIKIFSMEGKLCKSYAFDQKQAVLDLSTLENSMYLLVVETPIAWTQQKFMKIK